MLEARRQGHIPSAEASGTVRLGKRVIAISGQSVPILRCVKYCALRGRSGYIFTSPILRDGTECQSHLRLCNARWIPGSLRPATRLTLPYPAL
jgi:hypothetical protein